MRTIILFDLDGTLTESGTGIIRSVQHALRSFSIEEGDVQKLRNFIGPPLVDSFQKYYGFSAEEAEKAVSVYRERFAVKGIFENALYPGVAEMLQTLKKNGFVLAVSSSKPEKFVHQVLDYFQIASFFDVIVGSTLDGRRKNKIDVIRETFLQLDTDPEKDRLIMIGDTEHDVKGAKEAGIPCIVVTYGYGDPERIRMAEPWKIAESVPALTKILLSL